MTAVNDVLAPAVGAAVGAGVWQLLVMTTHSPGQRLVAVLAVAMLSAGVIGGLSGGTRKSVGAPVIWSAAGTACAPVLVVGFGMMQRPLWSLAFVALYPVVVTLGYAVGRVAARGGAA